MVEVFGSVAAFFMLRLSRHDDGDGTRLAMQNLDSVWRLKSPTPWQQHWRHRGDGSRNPGADLLTSARGSNAPLMPSPRGATSLSGGGRCVGRGIRCSNDDRRLSTFTYKP
jgi:hypothetical protein